MTCEKSVRPVFTVMPPIGKIEEFTAQTVLPSSNRHQAYLGANHCPENEIPHIERIEPDSSGKFSELSAASSLDAFWRAGK